MNNKLEVIGIDHGWSMMKTISQVFVTGVKEITTTPALFGDVLEYEGKFYKVGTVRQEVKDTKVEDGVGGADKILDYYRASKGAFLCIQKNKKILHYGYIIKQSL